MLNVAIRHSHVVLNSCCIINLAATGEFDNILECISAQFAVAAYVSKHEVLTYITLAGEEVPISLEILVKKGLILEVEIDYSNEDEPNYVVAFAAQNLDSGEADSAAIAIHRGWAIATDDKRAINVIRQTSPKTQIVTTPELMKLWVDNRSVPEEKIKQAIRSIRKYMPPQTHPLVNWWKQYL